MEGNRSGNGNPQGRGPGQAGQSGGSQAGQPGPRPGPRYEQPGYGQGAYPAAGYPNGGNPHPGYPNQPGAGPNFGGPGHPGPQYQHPGGSPRKNASGIWKPLAIVLSLLVIIGLVFFFVNSKKPQDGVNAGAQASHSSPATQPSPRETAGESTASATDEEAGLQEPPAEKEQDHCTIQSIQQSPGFSRTDTIVECQGNWAYAGIKQTDAVHLLYWTGDKWERYGADGKTFTDFSCYDKKKLINAGAPPSIINRVTLCRNGGSDPSASNSSTDLVVDTADGAVANSHLNCDGSYILILDSVIVNQGEDATKKIAAALDLNPGASFAKPGACPSLRAQTDGADIYPVFLDFGSDTTRLCSEKAQRGGNARELNTTGKMLDPC